MPADRQQPGAEDLARVQRKGFTEFVAPAREIAQHQREPRCEPAREPAAGRVVAGEEEVGRQHHDEREDDARGDFEHQRPVPRVAQLAAPQPRDIADGRAVCGHRQPSDVGLTRVGDSGCGAETPVPEHHRRHTGRGDQQHHDLAHGVPCADVDEQHVDGVGAVATEIRCVGQQFSDRRARAGRHRVNGQRCHRRADRERERRPRQPVPVDVDAVGLGGQRAQHQHEDDQHQRLDQELRQSQIGCTVEREDRAAAVTRHPDQQYGRQSVAHDGRAERGRQHDEPDHDLHR